jgi:aspartate kinase
MKVFKFGGASVKDAVSVKNVSKILGLYPKDDLLVVVSAMGKTTNSLEEVVKAIVNQERDLFNNLVEKIQHFHWEILSGLFDEKHFSIYSDIEQLFERLLARFDQPISENESFEYDQIVSLGEVISTKIIDAYLREIGQKSSWMDVKRIIRTNNTYQEGEVDWHKTEQLVEERLKPLFDGNRIIITQGFIGATSEGFTTTLGREGSDFTAGILAYCLNAESVTIWKDVPGMLNADPRVFSDTVKLDILSFKEAIELSYYGASVIHPKTVKPLQNKDIQLHVKSFLEPEKVGTVIQEKEDFDHLVPSFIVKNNQLLISLTPKDFSFIEEFRLAQLFQIFSKENVHVNLMQNSALSFSVLIDQQKLNLSAFIALIQNDYKVKYNENLSLLTIRHFDQDTIDKVKGDREVIVEQRTRDTCRMVLR